jgi:hypothetical protein
VFLVTQGKIIDQFSDNGIEEALNHFFDLIGQMEEKDGETKEAFEAWTG